MVSEWLLALFCWRDSMRSTYVLLGLGGMLLLLDATLVRNNNCIKNWIQICALFHELAYIMTCNLNQTRISEPWRKFNQSYKKSVYICVHLSSVKSIKISHINFGTLKSWVLFDTKNSILFVSLLRGGGLKQFHARNRQWSHCNTTINGQRRVSHLWLRHLFMK